MSVGIHMNISRWAYPIGGTSLSLGVALFQQVHNILRCRYDLFYQGIDIYFALYRQQGHNRERRITYLVEMDIWLFIILQRSFLEIQQIPQGLVVDLDVRHPQKERSFRVLNIS